MLETWKKAKVIRIEGEAKQTKRFWLEVGGIERFDFKSGQFVTLDLPIHEQKNKRWRSYSIASSPNATNIFELVIALQQNGAGTNYLFNEVNIGTEISFKGPLGVFTLPNVITEDLFFICTSTGIAPFRSMCKYIFENQLSTKNIHLIFGCNSIDDALYQIEFEQLQEKYSNFKYHPVFSKDAKIKEAQIWLNIHDVYTSIIKMNKNQPALFYLCGWKEMIDEAKQRIIDLGYDRKKIHLELYG